MSPTPITMNPSQTVERIREIIVGRHLERLEVRVSRLESSPGSAPSGSAPDPHIFEDRLLATEAHVEALQDHAQRMEDAREDIERTAAMYRDEAQRLAAQIQEVAREKSASATAPAADQLERKLGVWLSDWQKSMNSRLESRDGELIAEIRREFDALRNGFETRFGELESKIPTGIDDRLNRIASAARALAESAGSMVNQSSTEA